MKKVLSLVLIVLLMSSLSACVSPAKLIVAAEDVKYVTKSEAPENCTLLGEVAFESFESSGSIKETKIMFRNKTARMGGNFLVFDYLNGPNDANGRAYNCR